MSRHVSLRSAKLAQWVSDLSAHTSKKKKPSARKAENKKSCVHKASHAVLQKASFHHCVLFLWLTCCRLLVYV